MPHPRKDFDTQILHHPRLPPRLRICSTCGYTEQIPLDRLLLNKITMCYKFMHYQCQDYWLLSAQTFLGKILPQTGNAVPATAQVTDLCVSTTVHLSMVPSVQVRLCNWVPAPHVGSSPSPLHEPSFVHSPNIFEAEMEIRLYFDIDFLIKFWNTRIHNS